MGGPGFNGGSQVEGVWGIIGDLVGLSDGGARFGDDFDLGWFDGEIVGRHNLIFWNSCKYYGILVITTSLGRADIDFVADLSRLVADREILRHDDLGRFGTGDIGELTEIAGIGEVLGGTDAYRGTV